MLSGIWLPAPVRGQITVLILLALLTVILAGRPLERMINRGNAVPSLEYASAQVNTLALLMRDALPSEREVILQKARAGGLQVSIAPASLAAEIRPSRGLDSVLNVAADFLFPPDGSRRLVDGGPPSMTIE